MKKYLIIVVTVIVLGVIGYFFNHTLSSYKKEINRLSYNITVLNQQKDSVIDKNGELHYVVNTLNLKSSELEKINSGLTAELKNMKVKIKNLENASVIDIQYKYIHDTIISEKTSTNKYLTTIDTPYYSANWKSTVNDSTLIVSDYNTQFNDTIITATEIKYKGWWFWRKPKEIKFHIKSKNPYSNINKIENIKF